MKFDSEEMRMQHPQARFIPQSMWVDNELFNHELPDNLLELLSSNEQVIENLARLMTQANAPLKFTDNQQKRCAFLAIVLSRQTTLTTSELDKISDLLKMNGTCLFLAACALGNVDFFLHVAEGYRPDARQRFTEDSGFTAFYLAIANGHLRLLEQLKDWWPRQGQLQDMIADWDLEVFRRAAANGHLHILTHLKDWAPRQLKNMIADWDFGSFREAAAGGHLHILTQLKDWAPRQLNNMIAADDFGAFREAAAGGHLHILTQLKDWRPHRLQRMIAADDFGAFRYAAENGHLHLLEQLKAWAPVQLQHMIAADDFGAFRGAAAGGHLHILTHLRASAPRQRQHMIAADDFGAFREAAAGGHLPVLRQLQDWAPGQLQLMIAADDFGAFREAVRFQQQASVNYLLNFSLVFNYAEQHENKRGYEDSVHGFIMNKLATLRSQKTQVEQDNPHAIFDLSNNGDATLCFYMLRNLIRRDTDFIEHTRYRFYTVHKSYCDKSKHLEEIRFLLEIPAVKALAHAAVSPGMPNELLQLARAGKKQSAARLLMATFAVHDADALNFGQVVTVEGFDERPPRYMF